MNGVIGLTCLVLDMEWSQPVTKEKTAVSGMLTLPVEIIQIGAVIVKDGVIAAEKFSEYVKPVYYTALKSRIKKLTGITEKDLMCAERFEAVMERFREWCSGYSPDIIATWGPDDIPLLKAQSRFYGYDDSWLPDFFNLQPLFTRQHNIDRPQINLEAAIEIIGADGGALDFHSAVNDAYYTALILLDIKNLDSSIEWQRKIDYAHANPYISFISTVYGKRKFSRISSALLNKSLSRHTCPLCGKPVSLSGRFVRVRQGEYLSIVRCAKHSTAVEVKFNRDSERGYSWVKTTKPAAAEQETLYTELYGKKLEAKPHRSMRGGTVKGLK